MLVTALLAAILPSQQATARPGTPLHRLTSGGVTATVSSTRASLSNRDVTRVWSLTKSGAATVILSGRSGRSMVRPGPDFQVSIDGVTTSSITGWRLAGVSAAHPPREPGRPGSQLGASLRFHYFLVDPALSAVDLELIRTVTLRPGSSVFEVSSTMVSRGTPARVTSYSLDQVWTGSHVPAVVETFHGGSDWRDDYRHTSRARGAFDREGEVVRFGRSKGIFLVSQQRSGSMSRVGRDGAGRAWVGVDWARDAFDFGPLRTDPPDYNRLDNPAYPVPIRSRLLPAAGRLDLGTSYLGVYAGGADQAAATFTHDFVAAAAPFERSVGVNTFHPWSHGPGMTDRNLRRQVRIARRLGVETFMLDDQWQGGDGGESGDWRFDPARFPDRNDDGTPDFVTYVHRHGLALGLWMSPLEFNQASKTYAAHPAWACAPVGDGTAQVPDDAGLGVWDATNPRFQHYLLDVVSRLIRTTHAREFKFDFMAWLDCGTHDYADYEAAFIDLVHRMQRTHPHVTFELDETNDQRSWPFESAQIGPSWFDNGHLHGRDTAVGKLLHDVWSAAPWVPVESIGVGLYDGTLSSTASVNFLMPLAMLTHLTFWTDLSKLTARQRTRTAWWIRWYKAHRDEFGRSTYELTSHDPLSGKGWAAWQLGSARQAFVFGFRQAGGTRSAHLRLHGLSPHASYLIRDVGRGRGLGAVTGRHLSRRLRVALAQHSAVVLSLTRR